MIEIKSKLVDIICPLYNKEKYIDDFLSSLVIMPSDKVNVILIDDGSTDATKRNIEDFISMNKVENFYYYYKVNGGVSSARNKGIDESMSKYIWFCDPDDIIVKGALDIFKNIESINSDILVYSYITAFEENRNEIISSYQKDEYSTTDFLREYDYFTKKNAISTVWNKLYKREYIHNIRFPEHMNHSEDRYFNLSLLNKPGSVTTNNSIIYRHKRYAANTLSTVRSTSRINDIIKADLFNISVLSNIKDVKREKKIHVYRVSREKMMASEINVSFFYFKQCKQLGIKPYSIVSARDLVLCAYFYIFNK